MESSWPGPAAAGIGDKQAKVPHADFLPLRWRKAYVPSTLSGRTPWPAQIHKIKVREEPSSHGPSHPLPPHVEAHALLCNAPGNTMMTGTHWISGMKPITATMRYYAQVCGSQPSMSPHTA